MRILVLVVKGTNAQVRAELERLAAQERVPS